MPNEAKFGLVIGVGLVILIAVVFFRRETAQAKTADPASAAVKPPGSLSAPRSARTVSARKSEGEGQSAREGETPYRPGAGVLPRQRTERTEEGP
jgi:hypothetical protein